MAGAVREIKPLAVLTHENTFCSVNNAGIYSFASFENLLFSIHGVVVSSHGKSWIWLV